jgi:hypothetical protein
MARKKREDELAALRAENARLKALLEQQEAAPHERLPQPAPAEAQVVEVVELPAPELPKRPRKPRRKQVQDTSPSFLTYLVSVVMVLGYVVALPVVLAQGFNTNWAPPWNWLLVFLIVLAFAVFVWLKARENQRERERLARAEQKALERFERLQQKEQARIARLQERERAKAAAPKKPREKARPRITRPLRAPITQKLEPEDAP